MRIRIYKCVKNVTGIFFVFLRIHLLQKTHNLCTAFFSYNSHHVPAKMYPAALVL